MVSGGPIAVRRTRGGRELGQGQPVHGHAGFNEFAYYGEAIRLGQAPQHGRSGIASQGECPVHQSSGYQASVVRRIAKFLSGGHAR